MRNALSTTVNEHKRFSSSSVDILFQKWVCIQINLEFEIFFYNVIATVKLNVLNFVKCILKCVKIFDEQWHVNI